MDVSELPVVILCGGFGTRLREETEFRPKPLVEIGGKPILWHIMKIYSAAGARRFILCLGYKGEMIKDYFLNYDIYNSDFTIHLGTKEIVYHHVNHEESDWKVQLVDTGLHSMTGGRVKRIAPYVQDGLFMLTYGDGVADINVARLLDFHLSHGRIATVTGVHPVARFGELAVDGNRVVFFREKPQTQEAWVNGGFFVFDPRLFAYLGDDNTVLEREPLERLAADGQLMVYQHEGFWYCMDTLRDVETLRDLWESGKAPWKIWK